MSIALRKSANGRERRLCLIDQNTDQLIPNGAATALTFASAGIFQTKTAVGMAETASNRVRIPRPGMYSIYAWFGWTAETNGACQMQVLVDGGVVMSIDDAFDVTAAHPLIASQRKTFFLPQDSLITLRVTQASGGGSGDATLTEWILEVCEE
jgi:hypothetical protein